MNMKKNILTLLAFMLVLPCFGETAKFYFNKALRVRKDTDKVKYYTLAIDKNKKFANAYLNRGAIHLKLENYDKSIADLTRATELNPSGEKAYYYRAIGYYRTESYDEAVSDLSKALNRKSDFMKAYYFRARAFQQLKFFDDSLQDYSKAISLEPKKAYLYHYRAITFAESEKYDNALSDFGKAIAFDPKNPVIRKNRGCLNLKLKNFKDAYSDLTKALKMDKNLSEAHICIAGYWWMYKKSVSKAVDTLEIVFKSGFDDIEALYDVKREGFYFTTLVDTPQFKRLVEQYSKANGEK